MVDFGQVVTGVSNTVGKTADVFADAAGLGGGRRPVRKSSVKRRPVRRRSRGGNQVQEDFNEQVAMNGGVRRRRRSVRRRRSRGGNQVQEDFNEQVAMEGGARRRRRRRTTRGGFEVAPPTPALPMKMQEKKDKVQEMMSVEEFALFGGARRRKAKKVSGDSKIKKMLKVEKMAKAKVVKEMKVATKAAKVARSARISINKMKSKKASH
jgi:hypothetical protein